LIKYNPEMVKRIEEAKKGPFFTIPSDMTILEWLDQQDSPKKRKDKK